MSNVAKLSLAVGLGLVAGILYYVIVRMTTLETSEYVAVKADLTVRDKFEEDKLVALELPRSVGQRTRAALIPYADRALLIGKPVPRDYEPGDVVFWRDVEPPETELELGPDETALHIALDGLSYESRLLVVGNDVGFVVAEPARTAGDMVSADESSSSEFFGGATPISSSTYQTLGPFRIVSVGRRLSSEDDDGDRWGSAPVVSIATVMRPDGTFDEQTSRLLAAKDRGRNEVGGLTAMVLYSRPSADRTVEGDVAGP